jgi:hypothetical protein
MSSKPARLRGRYVCFTPGTQIAQGMSTHQRDLALRGKAKEEGHGDIQLGRDLEATTRMA